ncbi:MAG: hypothetical protein IPL28_27305 [Chloroflexi bacterium]|nr:hypothetical protein [Chloroflexota bacterium]
MRKMIWILAVLLLSVVACGGEEEDPNRPLTTEDFATVCAGQAQPRAAAYTPETAPNQIMLLSDSTIGDQYDYYNIRFTSELPEEWFPQIVDGTFDFNPAELVTCIHRTATELADTCEYEDNYILEVFNSTYEVTVYAAQTGENLVRETVEASGECPSMFMFDEGITEDVYYADISEKQIGAIIERFAP